MPEHSKGDSEIFEIARIGNSDSSENCGKPSRSLVFKFSKICKDVNKNQEIASEFPLKSYEINKENTDTEEKVNIEKLNPNKENNASDSMDVTENFRKCPDIPEEKSITQALENKNVQLRRSSRRIILRTKEDFLPDPRVVKRKKRRSKIHKVIQGKKIPGRRGRPRKNSNLQFPKLSDKEWDKTGSSKGLMSWTLQPKQLKECSNFCCPEDKYNDFFDKNYVPLSDEPFISQNSFHSVQAADNVLFKTPNFLESTARQKQHLSTPSPCKPTIIYFKCPKNRQKLSIPGGGYSKKQHSLKNFPQYNTFSHKEYYNFTHLRNKYSVINETILDHFYNVSKGDIGKTEMMLQELLVRELKLLRRQDIHPLIENSESTWQVPKVIHAGSHSVQPLETEVGDHYMETEEVDTLYRQVIIDSIRLLYDEHSVTGYA